MPESSPQGAPSPARRRRRWALLLTLAIILALGGTAWWLAQRAQSGAAAPGGGFGGRGGAPGGVTVGTAVAEAGSLPVLIDALGTVTPPAVTTLVPQVSGILTEVHFTEGQMVNKGDLLARIDPRTYEQALAQARGQRARDAAQLQVAKVTLARYDTLWKQDSIARQDRDNQAALVQQLRGVVEADAAAEQAAQINLGFTKITAPISGRIGLRAVDPGNLVSTGTTSGIATITQITPIDVLFSVPQDQVQAVLEAQRQGALPVLALNRARTQTLAEGEFRTLNNEVNTATGTVLAKARFANADGRLFPNEFVNARLQLGQTQGVLVPITAVRTGPDGDYVFVVDDQGVAHMRAVTTAMSNAEQALITDGLKAGDVVVSQGGDRVRDGSPVRTLQSESGDTAKAGDAATPRAARKDEGEKGGAPGAATQPAPAASSGASR